MLSKYSKNRLNYLEDKMNDSNTLAYEEAVMEWRDLSVVERIRLVKISQNDKDLILNIYKAYFNYNI